MCHNLDQHNIVKYIDCFQALVFESLDINLLTTWRWKTLPLCFWETSEPSSNRYEHSTIRGRAKQCTLSFRFESILTDLVLSDDHSIWCAEGDRGDPHWCQTAQHYDGESPPRPFEVKLIRLQSGLSHDTGQGVQRKANIQNCVKQIICFIMLEKISSLLFLPWRSSRVLPPCNMCITALHKLLVIFLVLNYYIYILSVIYCVFCYWSLRDVIWFLLYYFVGTTKWQ